MSHRDKIKAYQEAGDDSFAPGSGGCLQRALKSLGVDTEIEDFVPFDELESLVKALGLRYFGAGKKVTFPPTTLACIIYEGDDERMTHAQTMTMRHAQTEGLLTENKLRAIITR